MTATALRNSRNLPDDFADDDTITATAWDRPHVPTLAHTHPDARPIWLPIIGPSGWLLSSTLATAVVAGDHATWPAGDLARAHGTGTRVLALTMRRLEIYRLAHQLGAGHYLVMPGCPPLRDRDLRRLPLPTQQAHAEHFPPPA